jgi:hypothetical protein
LNAPSSTASPPSTNGVQIGTHIPLNAFISGPPLVDPNCPLT